MKRIHLHIGVENIQESINFYSALFDTAPVKIKEDYAQWLLDDPRLNLAISTQVEKGIDHLGIQVEHADELEHLRKQVRAADISTFDEGETVCCYAKSDKAWVEDPSGVAWESYLTLENANFYHGKAEKAERSGCCAPS